MDVIYTALEELNLEIGFKAKLSHVNLLLEACKRVFDLRRAFEILEEFKMFGVEPTQESYEIVAWICVRVKSPKAAVQLLRVFQHHQWEVPENLRGSMISMLASPKYYQEASSWFVQQPTRIVRFKALRDLIMLHLENFETEDAREVYLTAKKMAPNFELEEELLEELGIKGPEAEEQKTTITQSKD